MELNEKEIKALEKIKSLCGCTWFKIVNSSFIWDAENKKKLSVKDGVREFLSCYESHIRELDVGEQYILSLLWDRVNIVDFSFEG